MNDTAAEKPLPKPTDFDQLYPGRFLKAGDLAGKKVTVTIKDINLDRLESTDGKKTKGILELVETDRQVVLNKTNGLCIRAMFGRKLADWAGKRITLFAGSFNGEDCIRIWGSPELEKDMDVVIELPRKKPTRMTMHRVNGAKPAATAASSREPGQDDEPGLELK
jgi:hypothetical protein